jgi:ABC-type uncharacterized transport system auxiliary subunit
MQKRRMQLVAAVALIAGICSGCSAGRPYHYYWLEMPAAPATATQASASHIKLVVARVMTPHLYRDDRLVYGSGDVQLGTYEYERWAEMPADMVQDALISSLRATGQYRSVTRTGSAARGDYVLRSQLFALYGEDRPNTVARFSMQVELFEPKTGMTLWNDSYAHDEPLGSKNVDGLVEALNKNVRAGMQHFTSDLGQYFAEHPPQDAAGTQK